MLAGQHEAPCLRLFHKMSRNKIRDSIPGQEHPREARAVGHLSPEEVAALGGGTGADGQGAGGRCLTK